MRKLVYYCGWGEGGGGELVIQTRREFSSEM